MRGVISKVISRHNGTLIPFIGPITSTFNVVLTRILGRSIHASKVIANHLEMTYVPPKPEFGPPFVRGSFKSIFSWYLRPRTVLPMFFGPSGTGKTTAILNELAGKQGVIVVSLRNAQAKDVANAIVKACGSEAEMPDWSTFELTFKRAMQRYRKRVGRDARSIIVIEDMHAVRNDARPELLSFLGKLIQLQFEGFSSVIFSVSDYRAIRWVTAHASGYSTRLKPILFPAMGEEEFIAQLSKASKEHKLVETMTEELKKRHNQIPYTEDKQPAPITSFIILDDHKITKIVNTLGTHMGEVINCLLIHLAGDDLDKALDEMIETTLVRVHQALSYSSEHIPMEANKGDTVYYETSVQIVIGNILLRALSDDSVTSVEWFTILEGVKFVERVHTGFMVQKALENLIAANVLSYVSNTKVGLHAKSVRLAYARGGKELKKAEALANELVLNNKSI